MASTTNYAWTTPDNSGLVKNGAQDIRTLGSAIDTSLWNVGFGQAGKNKIINGDFGIWQRGTTWTDPAFGTYTSDRYYVGNDGTGSKTFSRQTFTAGTAPVSGYEGTYFFRANQTTAGSGGTYSIFGQKIEDVRTFAGQTVTLSFWAKSAGTSSVAVTLRQDFGSGGSSVVDTAIIASTATTTGWVRYTGTVALPSISGKTIGTGSSLIVLISLPINTTYTLDFWGVQLEAGAKATPFQTATGTIQGELAACQRYYYRLDSKVNYSPFAFGVANSTGVAAFLWRLPVTMRTSPTSVDYSTLSVQDSVSYNVAPTSITVTYYNTDTLFISATGLTGATQFRPYFLLANNSTAAYLAASAEL